MKKTLRCLFTPVSRKESLVILLIERYLLNLQPQAEGKQSISLHKYQNDKQHRFSKFFYINQYYGIIWNTVSTTAWHWEIDYAQDPNFYVLFELLTRLCKIKKESV